MKTIFSIGNIGKSIFYLGIENGNKYHHLSFGKTYHGTIGGVLIAFGKFSILAHVRNPFFKY